VGSHPSPNDHIDPTGFPAFEAEYRDHFVQNYRFSGKQAMHLRKMVGAARTSGLTVSFAQFPNYWLEDINPQAEHIFQTGINAFAADLGVPMFDFSTELRTDQSLWADPLHLNAQGAMAFAPILARSLGEI
jgi:lysophospholipase L1-like esterase